METQLGLTGVFASKSTSEILEVINQLPYAYYRSDLEGRIIAASEGMRVLMGCSTMHEVLKVTLQDTYFDPDGRHKFLRKLDESGGWIFDYEAKLKKKSGNAVWVATSAHYVRDATGKVSGVEGLVRDISTDKSTISSLAFKESLFEVIANKINYAVSVYELDGNFVYSNETMNEIIGLDLDNDNDRDYNVYDEMNQVFETMARKLDKKVLAGESIVDEEKIVRSDGITRYLSVSKSLLENRDRKYIFTIIKDGSEKRLREAETIQSSKLTALGELAAGVAHELNQPLNVITLAIANMKRKGDVIDHAFLEKKLATIDKQVARASKIINQLRTFARTADETGSEGDLVEAVGNTLLMFCGFLEDSNINVETHYDQPNVGVCCDQLKLEQICLNLLSNSRDAIEERRSRAPPEEGQVMRIEVNVEIDSQNGILRINDTGIGIKESIVDRVLEPFFTTKDVGKGTGLGLSVSQGFVAKAGGTITVVNTDDGAQVTIKIPLLKSS